MSCDIYDENFHRISMLKNYFLDLNKDIIADGQNKYLVFYDAHTLKKINSIKEKIIAAPILLLKNNKILSSSIISDASEFIDFPSLKILHFEKISFGNNSNDVIEYGNNLIIYRDEQSLMFYDTNNYYSSYSGEFFEKDVNKNFKMVVVNNKIFCVCNSTIKVVEKEHLICDK